jgi:alkanesulfonate monooxygenase SsuD/methylene tetrahydromethanopterin reductase-like flavin-dependent oxidoreductase (luciferase family)
MASSSSSFSSSSSGLSAAARFVGGLMLSGAGAGEAARCLRDIEIEREAARRIELPSDLSEPDFSDLKSDAAK